MTGFDGSAAALKFAVDDGTGDAEPFGDLDLGVLAAFLDFLDDSPDTENWTSPSARASNVRRSPRATQSGGGSFGYLSYRGS